jgi:hypothetical protein
VAQAMKQTADIGEGTQGNLLVVAATSDATGSRPSPSHV